MCRQGLGPLPRRSEHRNRFLAVALSSRESSSCGLGNGLNCGSLTYMALRLEIAEIRSIYKLFRTALVVELRPNFVRTSRKKKMPKSLLPREGLTMEALFAPIRLTLLEPLLMGPLLLGLHRHPTFAAKWLPPNVFKVVSSTHLLRGLGILFGIGLLRRVNNKLSKLVLNNFRKDTSWDWTKEIVVVTGGSGGIGASVVRMFAEKNIKVIILDVLAPPTSTKSFEPFIFVYS